jgi:small subunit ribosomal protein S16
MSVKIRLRRDGAKKRPFYHVVAADERRARNGRFIEELGYYNPIVAADAEPILVLKEERVRYWLSVGAQPSDTAAALLKKQGILERRTAASKSAKAAAPAAETPAAPVAAAAATPAAGETPAGGETEENSVEASA